MNGLSAAFNSLCCPATYETVARLALTSREPYKSHVLGLVPGQPLHLRREPDNARDGQAIAVKNESGQPVGYLYADMAGWLSILLDHDPGIFDETIVESVMRKAPPDDPAARRLRYPRLFIRVRLRLENAWPFFVIAAMLGIKDPDAVHRFDLPRNSWLMPMKSLCEQYARRGHDEFHLPPELVAAWREMTLCPHENDDCARVV